MASSSTIHFSSEPFIQGVCYKRNKHEEAPIRPEIFFPDLNIVLTQYGFKTTESPRNVVYEPFKKSVTKTYQIKISQQELKTLYLEWEPIKMYKRSRHAGWCNLIEKIKSFIKNFIANDGSFKAVSEIKHPMTETSSVKLYRFKLPRHGGCPGAAWGH